MILSASTKSVKLGSLLHDNSLVYHWIYQQEALGHEIL